jgi:hypothetical protein
VDHCYGAKFGGYDYHDHDLLVVDSVFDHDGWEQTVAPKNDIQGREHDWYTAINPPSESIDPQHRFIDVVFGRADSEGYEGDDGGLADSVLYLANPIGGYLGVYQSMFHNVVVDGGGGEFDSSGPGSGLAIGPSGTAEKASAFNRGWGIFGDCAVSCTFDTVTCINKPENINCGWALAVDTADKAKGLPSLATQASFVNCKVDNWFVWSGDPNTSSPNIVSTNNGPAPTITYSGCYFPQVINVAGVNAAVPAYVDPTRCASSYARTLGVTAIKDGPSLLDAMDGNWSGNWDDRLLASSAVNWIQAGFAIKQ